MTRYAVSFTGAGRRIEMGEDIRSPIVVTSIRGLDEKPETTTGDRARTREDGDTVGRDRLRGRTVTIEGFINAGDADTARQARRELMAAWSAPDVRGIPGMAVPLEVTWGGATGTVYGRPRPLAPRDDAAAALEHGMWPFVAAFKCIDHLIYGPERSLRVPFVTDAAGGLTWPVRWPLRWTPRSATDRSAGHFEVGGSEPSWLQVTVLAPGGIIRPVIAIEDVLEIELDLTLPADATAARFVTVIASPWARSVLVDGRTPAYWALTPRSGLLKHARIPPGVHEASLRGTDPTGTAALALSWRDAWSSM